MRFSSTFPWWMMVLIACSSEEQIAPTQEETPVGLIHNILIDVEGRTRSYELYVPTSYDEMKKYPIVIDLHGATHTTTIQRGISELDQVAESEGFIVIRPMALMELIGPPINAMGSSWSWNVTESDRDIAFISKLLTTIPLTYSTNSDQVYVIGFSMGGIMAYTLACELNNIFAAIGVVSASMNESTMNGCQSHLMPVISFHGTADSLMLFNGSESYMSALDVANFWSEGNACQSSVTTDLPDASRSDNSNVVLYTYQNCHQEADVQMYVVENGGHSWPGSTSDQFRANSNHNMDVDATLLIWEFLSRYTLASKN